MEVQHVNASSWQPLLCTALIEELLPLCVEESNGNSNAIFTYLSGRRGQAILEILALAQWKTVAGPSGFLRVLTKAWKSVHDVLVTNEFDETGNGVDLQEYDLLLPVGDGKKLPESPPIVNGGCHVENAGHVRTGNENRTRIRRKKRKQMDKLHTAANCYISDDDARDSTELETERRKRRFGSSTAAVLLGYPGLLGYQEDSDGFPASWYDEGLSTITEGVRMNVDDIILPIIRASLPKKLKFDDNEPAVTLALLSCLIGKVLPFLSSSSDSSVIWDFIDVFMSTCGVENAYDLQTRWNGKNTADDSGSSVAALKRAILVHRHGTLALISALTIDKSDIRRGVLVNCMHFLLRILKLLCQSLGSAPLTFDYFELLRTEGCMEYLLEMAADLVTGIFRVVIDLFASVEKIFDTTSAAFAILEIWKETNLIDMVRDVCIGLDLLASIDITTDHSRISPESNPKPYLDNIYRGKLYAILFHIVALINSLQLFRAVKSHLSICAKSDHRRCCCVWCMARHHNGTFAFLEFNPAAPLSSSATCSLALLEKMVLSCFRNVAGLESKQMCIEALESFPSCCCVPKMDLVTILLEALVEFSPGVKRGALFECFQAKLSTSGQCAKNANWNCQICGLLKNQRPVRAYTDEEKSETDQFSIAWSRFVENSSSDDLETFFRLLRRIFPVSDEYFQDKVTRVVLIPRLLNWCQNHSELLKTQTNLSTSHLQMYSLLIHLCKIGIKSIGAYSNVLEHLFEYADILFDHPDTRTVFLRFVRQMAIVEWDVLTNSAAAGASDRRHSKSASTDDTNFVFNRFLFNKFYLVGKLILNDTQNFVSDTAREFWMTSEVLWETCLELLKHSESTNTFRLIFTDFGGFAQACRIIEVTIQCLFSSGSSRSEIGMKSSQRLIQLLGDTVGLCLASGASDQKMSKVFAPLRALLDRISANNTDRTLINFLANRLLEVALRQQRVEYGKDENSRISYSSSDDGIEDNFDLNSERGYEADAESERHLKNALKTDNDQNSLNLNEMLYQARLCAIWMEMLSTAYSNDGQLSFEDALSSARLLQRLASVCSTNCSYTKLLIDEGCITFLLKLAERFSMDGMENACSASLNLILLFFKQNPETVDLTPVLRIYTDRNSIFQDCLIECLNDLLMATPVEPSSYLTFPQPVIQRRIEERPKLRSPIHQKRDRSGSKVRTVSSSLSPEREMEDSIRKTSLSAVASANPFAPLLSGLSTLFTFGTAGTSSKKQLSSKSSTDKQSEAFGSIGNEQNKSTGYGMVFNAFTNAQNRAIAFPIDETDQWTLHDGLSIGVWVYFEVEPTKVNMDEVLHLLTVVFDQIVCTVSVQRSGKAIQVQPSNGELQMVELRMENFVPLRKWTHIIVNVSGTEGLCDLESLNVKIFCDGARQVCWKYPLYLPNMRNAPLLYVCLGSSSTNGADTKHAYRLGNVAGFRGDLSLEHSILVRSMGPNCVSVCDTKCRRFDGDLASLINSNLLLNHPNLNTTALLEDRFGLIEQLQKTQAFTFVSTQPDRVSFYSSMDNTGSNGKDQNESEDLCRRITISRKCGKNTKLECTRRFTIDEALAALGGIKMFLFLFVRAVECERSDLCQASALRLVLKAACRNPEWWRVFVDMQGYMVISRVLASPYCKRGQELLRAIFDFAISVNVFQRNDEPNWIQSTNSPDEFTTAQATIQDPLALTRFLLDPDIWKDEETLVIWQKGLEIIRLLVTSPAPAVANFNVCQLNMAKFLKFLFYFLTERMQDTSARLSSHLSPPVTIITSCLIGTPPNLSELTTCWDFLFLTHPASSTYLNYRISGPSDWLDPDTLTDRIVRLDNYESGLGTKLRQMMNSMGKNSFVSWIAREDWYLSDQPITPGQNKVSSSPSTSDVPQITISDQSQSQQLPDLVCDIDASTAAAEMSDSMRTASATDDDVFGGDEFVDALGDKTGDGGVEKWNSFKKETDSLWLMETRQALLGMMCTMLTTCDDTIYRRIVGSVVKWEHLLVMLRRQSEADIRIVCVKALCVLLDRSSTEQRLQFLKANGFALLANQLKEFPCPAEIVNDLFALFCGDRIKVDDMFSILSDVTVNIEHRLDSARLSSVGIDRFRAGVNKPLLVAYQNSLDDVALFWNLSTALCRAFQSNTAVAQTMLESHIGEVLANVLLQLSIRQHSETDISGVTDGFLMMEGWRSLASVVLHRCITRSNIHHHQAFSEFLQLLQCAAVTAATFGIEAQMSVRKELCYLIQLAFESAWRMFDETGGQSSVVADLPALPTNLSSLAVTPNPSGRQTPASVSDQSVSTLITMSLGPVQTTPKNATSTGSGGEKRRSSLSGSLTNLKERLFSISQGNLPRLSSGDTERLATQSEMLDRLKLLLQHVTEYFIFFSASDLFEECHLFDYLLHFALNTLANESTVRKRGNTWQSLMWGCRTKLQQFLSHLLIFVLYPAARNYEKLITADRNRMEQEWKENWIRRRLLIVEAWAHEPQAKSLLKYVLDSIAECQSIVTSAIYEILICGYTLNEPDKNNCRYLLKILDQLKAKSPFELYDNADEIVHNVCWDERATLEYFIGLRSKWMERMKSFGTRLKCRSQNFAQILSDDAMSITCAVVAEQNLPRKLFIQMKKQAANESLVAEEKLRTLAMDLCHPAGPCFHTGSWPVNYCLDPTEGPHRERRRLMPAHLNIPEKFLIPDYREKHAKSNEKRPLLKLLSGSISDTGSVSSIAGQLLEQLRIEDKIIFNCSAVVIRTSYECQGELLLGDRALYFVGESCRSSQKGLPLDSVISMNWSYHLITGFHRRYFQLIDLAVEVFFGDGETYLIAFETKEKRELFLNRLGTMELPNLTTYSDHLLKTLTAWWREGNITNFQYMMHLNTLAGRTFNDLMQYPVFPFILSDYTSMALNLNSPAVYRNLAKPIAIQDLQMESHYIHVYRSLESDLKRDASNLATLDSMPLIGAYHYGSHYSNSGIVASYLVRLPPFTQLVLEYQDNNFDLPDRTFHSISTAYRLSTSESTTDFKEMIPEFFFLSEFLTNREGLHFGHRQNGQSINDVELPPWCPNADPRLFILIHRQSLESAYVSAHLHQWVDLIFGYKQTGQAAVDAVNVFHPATYHGTLSAAADSDEIRLKALNTMVKTYGQMPKQLFKTPHLPHLIAQNYLTLTNMQQPQSPLVSVNGIRWGHYVGSPELPEPSLVLKQRNHGTPNVKPVSVMCLADGSCVGFPIGAIPIVTYGCIKRDLWLANVREVESIFIACWEFGDNVVRVRAVFPPDTIAGNWTNVIALHSDEITSTACCPGSSVMLFGLKNGVILVHKMELIKEGVKSCNLIRSLYGHRGEVSAIAICPQYSIFVTGSKTGECFLWDFNKLTFVLELRRHSGPITHVCISKTTCEIATVGLKGWGSQLVLHTVNGRVVGSIETDIVITSVTMSSAPEGTAVNCIATGMQNGLIRLWNMWTLAPIREICHSHFLEPIISLSYSHNSLKLYACTKSGAILCWDSGASKQIRPPRFFCLNTT